MIDTKLDFSDVLILPRVGVRPITRGQVVIESKFKTFSGLPLIVSNMPSIGTYKIANLLSKHRIVTFLYKDQTEDFHISQLKKMESTEYVGLTAGVREEEVQRVLNITAEIGVGFINLDTANIYGNFEHILRSAEKIKKMRPNILLSVGNICTPEIVGALAETGADLLKVGVGSGSACLTRSEVGIGAPQFSAVLETSAAARECGLEVISDGGCVTSGDVCKAIGAGARFVMLGGMLAGSYECENVVERDGKLYTNFWGLGSKKQYKLTNASEKEYRPNEGRELLVPCKGSILDVFDQVKGALRSVCSYVGAESIDELSQRATFIRVTNQINNSLAKYEVR